MITHQELASEEQLARIDPSSVDGWLSSDEGNLLAEHAKEKICLEIGSYKGKSTLYIAQTAKFLVSVDTFRANETGQAQDQLNSTYNEFAANLSGYENVVPVIGRSDFVYLAFKDDYFDFLFVDGMHDYNSVKSDVINYLPKLKKDSVVVFHDYSDAWPGVQRCVDELFGQPDEIVGSAALVKMTKNRHREILDSLQQSETISLETLPIFYINMDMAVGRKARITASLQEFGHEGVRRLGYVVEKLCSTDLPVGWNVYDHNRGMVGCNVSHYKIWQEIVEKDIPYACILEDDAVLVRPIRDIIFPKGADILFLNDRTKRNLQGVAIDGCGTDGYVVSKAGCEKLLRLFVDVDVNVDLRIHAHTRGFQENNVYMTKGYEYKSLLYPKEIIEGYKTEYDYVVHHDEDLSYILKLNSKQIHGIGELNEIYFSDSGASFLVRKDTWDDLIVESVFYNNEYGIEELNESDLIMDVGGHVGSFSMLAYQKGARKIHTYEVHPHNQELCEANLKDISTVHHYGLWRSDVDPIGLRFEASSNFVNTGGGAVVASGGELDIRLKRFDTELEQVLSKEGVKRIRLLKLDCEGSEFPILLTSDRLDLIDEIVGEYHLGFNIALPINGKTRFSLVDLEQVLANAGFAEISFKPSEGDSSLGYFFAQR